VAARPLLHPTHDPDHPPLQMSIPRQLQSAAEPFHLANGQTVNTTTKHIESVMRATVARWANLDPTNAIHAKVLQQWSSHSLRVGATNILYANGFTDHQIQTILRWESLAFMTYFRNLSIVSDKQNNAIFKEDEMVNLF
jgi:hypothetical protein